MYNENLNKSKLSSFVITKYPIDSKKVSITYDCGGNNEGSTSDILKILNKHQVKATFFVTGQWVEKYPLLAKRIVDEGHEIGNHSYSHPDFTKLTPTEIIEEVIKTENIIINAVGINPKPLIRQPYGSLSNEVLEIMGLIGYKYSIYWSIDPKDWELPPTDVIVNRILTKMENGAIILLHNHNETTASASDIFIPELKKQGFAFVVVGKMLTNMH